MITFGREGNKVTVHVEHGIFGTEAGFQFEIVQSHEYQAALLREALQNNMNRHLKELKEKWYNEGWKEAKARKGGKRTAFFGGWKF